ncbi:MAG: hypothetical protein P8Z76_16730 [Alphaproteobacteria bacterium]
MKRSDLGILVLGYTRPALLENVLESLRRQNALPTCHVWIDGTANRREAQARPELCVRAAKRFRPAEIRAHNGHLGIEKLMLDGLGFMSRHYDRFVVLEDDCFPISGAVAEFSRALDAVADRADVFSVYGHHFLTPSESYTITRFQGWGWATTSRKLSPVLDRLIALHDLNEHDYLEFVRSALTPEIVKRLDVTPGRDVTGVLERFFSWDSCTALLTASDGLVHRKTDRRVVYNCGMTEGNGHFAPSDRMRRPPFNMITPDEVWQVFENGQDRKQRARPSVSTTARSALRRGARRLRSLAGRASFAISRSGRSYYGLNELDRKITQFLPQTEGTFVELGAFDGFTQSNTLSFEKKGWRGVLIEPVPEAFKACAANRPLAKVFNCACVAATDQRTEIDITAVGLMSLVSDARGGGGEEEEWIRRGEQVQGLKRKRVLRRRFPRCPRLHRARRPVGTEAHT